jgi:hypothetical protein
MGRGVPSDAAGWEVRVALFEREAPEHYRIAYDGAAGAYKVTG